jgi:hypothetical protein
MVNEKISYKKITNRTNSVELRIIRSYLHNIRGKWEDKKIKPLTATALTGKSRRQTNTETK